MGFLALSMFSVWIVHLPTFLSASSIPTLLPLVPIPLTVSTGLDLIILKRNRGWCTQTPCLALSHHVGICIAVCRGPFSSSKLHCSCASQLIVSPMGPSFVHDSPFFSSASFFLSSFPCHKANAVSTQQ